MRKKNGFVFAETIIVVSILSLTLLMLYSSYSYILRKTKEKKPYDTVDTIYKTYYLKKVIENYSNGSVLNFVSSPKRDRECDALVVNKVYMCNTKYITDNSDWSVYNSRQHDLESIALVYNINKYYYIDMEYIKKDENKDILLKLDATTIDYINNISSSETKHFLVVKYVNPDTKEVSHSSVEVEP